MDGGGGGRPTRDEDAFLTSTSGRVVGGGPGGGGGVERALTVESEDRALLNMIGDAVLVDAAGDPLRANWSLDVWRARRGGTADALAPVNKGGGGG